MDETSPPPDWRQTARWYGSKLLRAIGYNSVHWSRVVYVNEWKRFLSGLPLKHMSVLEISPGILPHWRDIGFGTYEAAAYPHFDITTQRMKRKFDVIIAEHVFEHVDRPYDAAHNVRSMLKPSGIFLIATPFLIRVHPRPGDYTRWTPSGLQHFLEECGFDSQVHAWGNRKCVIANFKDWAEYGWWRDLRNEPEFPVSIWAYARLAAPADADTSASISDAATAAH